MFTETSSVIGVYAKKMGVAQPRLVAVSKTQAVTRLRSAYDQGARNFGENYVQEAIKKIPQLPEDCIWHLIGPLQNNKTRLVANHFDWVQSLDSYKTAERLSVQRPANMLPLEVCIQLNIDGEDTKSGCTPDGCYTLAAKLVQLPRLRLRGIMVIPQQTSELEHSRTSFLRAVQVYKQLQQQCQDTSAKIDTLSMGMSADWQIALESGSNLVRIGTAIFGAR